MKRVSQPIRMSNEFRDIVNQVGNVEMRKLSQIFRIAVKEYIKNNHPDIYQEKRITLENECR